MNNINLRKLVNSNPKCLTDSKELKSALLNAYPEIPSKAILSFIIVINSNLAADILSHTQITSTDKLRWKRKLMDHGISEEIAIACLNSFYDLRTPHTKQNSSVNIEDNQEIIADVSSNVLDVDVDILEGINKTAFKEEISNLKANIESLTNEKNSIKIPYPNVDKYDTGSDYDEIADLQYKKMSNKHSWDMINDLEKYLDSNSLYSGHLSCSNGGEYFFVDSFLHSKRLENNNVFVSVNDASYNEIFKKWKFPKKNDGIRFSRNIDIRYKNVTDVTIIYDNSNAIFSSISDLFLRNVLIKNKSNDYIQGIIQNYWFIQLYFTYLLGGPIIGIKKYIFIDETQDLAPTEINLLKKVSSVNSQSICNLFGDVNQLITIHGTRNWSQFDFIDAKFELNENFRNTNQIIAYCSEKIGISMKPVGVSMNPVKEYSSISDMLSDNIPEKVFIVKDEYDLQDLIQYLEKTETLNYKAFTVKEIKGLEFKQVIVFDEDMSKNEKYISYTRALIQLYVVTHSPWSEKKHVCEIFQDDE